MNTMTIPTPAELTAEAATAGFALAFEHNDQKHYSVKPHEGASEWVLVRDYIAYDQEAGYGIWALISEEPDKLAHKFYVVFNEDGAEVNGIAYEELDAALRYMQRLIEA